MAIGPLLFMMVHRPPPQFRLQTAKDRFQIGQHGVGPPQGGLIPGDVVGAQTVDPGMSQHRPVERSFLLGQGHRLGAALIRGQRDGVMLAKAVTALFEASNPFP